MISFTRHTKKIKNKTLKNVNGENSLTLNYSHHASLTINSKSKFIKKVENTEVFKEKLHVDGKIKSVFEYISLIYLFICFHFQGHQTDQVRITCTKNRFFFFPITIQLLLYDSWKFYRNNHTLDLTH